MAAKTKAATNGKSKAQLLFNILEEQQILLHKMFGVLRDNSTGVHVTEKRLDTLRSDLDKISSLTVEAKTAS
jgi:hypothetical protein